MTVCRLHGGKTPVGTASPHYQTGRYSKHLPERMAAKYLEAQQDKELLALREEIALLDARIADVLGRVDSGESGGLWRELAATHAELLEGRRTANAQRQVDALNAIGNLIERGTEDWAIWGNLAGLIEQRRKLVDSEWKRLVDMRQMITAEQAMVMLGYIVGTIQKHVHDRRALDAISRDLAALVDRGVGEAPITER